MAPSQHPGQVAAYIASEEDLRGRWAEKIIQPDFLLSDLVFLGLT